MNDRANASWFEEHPILSLAILVALVVFVAWLLSRNRGLHSAPAAKAIVPPAPSVLAAPKAPPEILISPWVPLP